MAKQVRIGFVGVGNMGQAAHLRNYVTIPDCQVAAIAEPRPGLARRVAEKYGIPKVYPDAEAMLAQESLDGLVASQPFDRHGRLITPLYRHGLPVFTEKPLAASVEVGERMVEALSQSGSWHMVGYHKRSDPAVMKAVEEIARWKASGELGAMRYVRVLMPAGDWVAGGFNDLVRTEEAPPAVPSDVEGTGSAAYVDFVNFYIHQVNLIRHLLGEPYRVTFADPTGVLMAGRSESGVACALEMTPYRTTVEWEESALVAFERGYLKIDLPAPLAHNRPGRLEIYRDPGQGVTPERSVPQLPWIHAMRQQAMNFTAAVRGDRKPMCQAGEALEDLKIARDYLSLRG